MYGGTQRQISKLLPSIVIIDGVSQNVYLYKCKRFTNLDLDRNLSGESVTTTNSDVNNYGKHNRLCKRVFKNRTQKQSKTS